MGEGLHWFSVQNVTPASPNKNVERGICCKYLRRFGVPDQRILNRVDRLTAFLKRFGTERHV